MLLFDNMAFINYMNGKNHCRTWWWVIAYIKLVSLFYCTKQFMKNLTILNTVNFHVRGWEMSKTQWEWITPAAEPLQRSYGVVAISQKYQNFKNLRWLRYFSYFTCIQSCALVFRAFCRSQENSFFKEWILYKLKF